MSTALVFRLQPLGSGTRIRSWCSKRRSPPCSQISWRQGTGSPRLDAKILPESSSIYWKAPYSLLEEAGYRVQILNPFDVKAKRGKKSDQSDAFRIAHMAMHSLVIPSFIPPSVIRDLRTLTRRRSKLVSSLRRAKTMISLLLDEGNFKFTLVGSDLFGVSGRLIMNELAYKSDVSPFYLAGLARGSLQRKVANLVPALSGRLNDCLLYTSPSPRD